MSAGGRAGRGGRARGDVGWGATRDRRRASDEGLAAGKARAREAGGAGGPTGNAGASRTRSFRLVSLNLRSAFGSADMAASDDFARGRLVALGAMARARAREGDSSSRARIFSGGPGPAARREPTSRDQSRTILNRDFLSQKSSSTRRPICARRDCDVGDSRSFSCAALSRSNRFFAEGDASIRTAAPSIDAHRPIVGRVASTLPSWIRVVVASRRVARARPPGRQPNPPPRFIALGGSI